MKLLTINSGWYRDIFSSSNSIFTAPGLISGNGSTVTATNVIGPPVVDTTVSASTFTISEQSDEVAHEDLRQATWLESLWAFDCTTDAVLGPTLTLYYRKYDVIGFCNVAPSL